jgi:HCNGP-like protein
MDALAAYGSEDDDSSSDSVEQEQRTIVVAPTKRQRVEPDDELFAPPLLGSDSMISWTKDYTEPYRAVSDQPSKQELPSVSSEFAANLTQQHEFRNPSFFGTVVEHFGIAEELGSHVHGEIFEDYEFRLLEIEERERQKQTEREQHAAMSCSNYYAQK